MTGLENDGLGTLSHPVCLCTCKQPHVDCPVHPRQAAAVQDGDAPPECEACNDQGFTMEGTLGGYYETPCPDCAAPSSDAAPVAGRLEMEAGRELDALIAEKVMGFPLEIIRGAPYPECPRHYSTDIAAAWEVVEKDDGWGHDWRVKRWVSSSKPYSCTAERTADGQNFYAEAETAPLAICLAALKAV